MAKAGVMNVPGYLVEQRDLISEENAGIEQADTRRSGHQQKFTLD
jgi:hypothetical protein